jgi:hypothetical protein
LKRKSVIIWVVHTFFSLVNFINVVSHLNFLLNYL